MAFLNFMKKKEELLTDIDLDMPPEPPKMMEEEIFAEEPIDEELMVPARIIEPKKAKHAEEELPELPPLPEIEEEPEMPPLPEEEKEFEPLLELPTSLEETSKEFGEEELELPLPPVPIKREKKGFFSFLKPKKAAEELPLPEIGEEFPEMPPLPEEERWFEPLPESEKEMFAPQPIEPLKPEIEKPLPKEVRPIEKVIKKFIVIDDFKQILGNISNTKGILKGIDDFFSKLEELEGSVDRKYSELGNNLQDIQRKIIFIDKTLFKEAA